MSIDPNIWTTYEYGISVGASGLNNCQLIIGSHGELTDDFALTLAAAIQGAPWPTGTTISLQRTAATSTSAQANLTAVPPVFA